jgi:hypothetical protein
MAAHGTWSDEVTRALLESAIEGEKRRLAAAATSEERERLRKRVQSLEDFHSELYSEPKPKPMSAQQIRALLGQAIRLSEEND